MTAFSVCAHNTSDKCLCASLLFRSSLEHVHSLTSMIYFHNYSPSKVGGWGDMHKISFDDDLTAFLITFGAPFHSWSLIDFRTVSSLISHVAVAVRENR